MSNIYILPPTIKTWTDIQYYLIENGHINCTIMYQGRLCGRHHEVGHHGIVHGDYSKKKNWKKYSDVLINYQPSCFFHNHTRAADLEENFIWNIQRQTLAGYDVLEYWNSLPYKYLLAHKDDERKIYRALEEMER